jgi:hypothetical protein
MSLQRVSLKVYDILGRELTTLVDEYQSGGYYSVVFDIEKIKQVLISSSIFICQLEVDKKIQTIKLIYLK